MQRSGFVLDVITYNATINALSLELLQAMQRHAIVLDAIAYNAAISALSLELTRAMQRYGFVQERDNPQREHLQSNHGSVR